MPQWKQVVVPASLWEKLRKKAEREGKSIAHVVRELLGELPEDAIIEEQTKLCVFCGQETQRGYICDDCFYDPEVIRPQIMGVWFTEYRLRMLQTTGNNLSLDDFAALFDYETAKSHYVTDEEWQEWQEWLEWRERHKKDPLARETVEWKRWVVQHPISKLRHLGAMFAVKVREGRGELESLAEILKKVSPAAFAIEGRRGEENANLSDRERMGDDSGSIGDSVGTQDT